VLRFANKTCPTERRVVNDDKELPASLTGVAHLLSRPLASFTTAFRFDAYGAIIGTNIHAVLPRTADTPTFLGGYRQIFSSRGVAFISITVSEATSLHDESTAGDSSIALEESLGRGKNVPSFSGVTESLLDHSLVH